LVLMMFSPAFLVPAIVGYLFGEPVEVLIFVYIIPSILTFLVGLILRRLGPETYEIMREREGYVVAASTWLLIPLFGGLPYLLSGVLIHPIDAYFEAMSGFTTVGASVIHDLEHNSVPRSLLLWRSLTAWVGGLGIIVLFMVFLSKLLGAGAARLLKAEVAGHTVTRLSPKLQQTAIKLLGIYSFFTVIEICLLIVAGMSPFEAVCHSFTSISTCGFSTRNASIGAYSNVFIEIVMIVFLIIGATNFNLHHEFLRGKWRIYIKDPEFRMLILIISLFLLIIAGDLSVNRYYSLPDAVRYGTFTTVSYIVTGGFVVADVTQWPETSKYVLMVAMFLGGCAGSTAGGLKTFRILLLLKVGRREVQKIIHPKAIMNITLGG
ncbi:MAG: TrkH family potassium uptake protein, partial [Thermoplasmata archaeon]